MIQIISANGKHDTSNQNVAQFLEKFDLDVANLTQNLANDVWKYSLDEPYWDCLDDLDTVLGKLNNVKTIAEWNYNTNLTDHNAEILKVAEKELTDFQAKVFATLQNFDFKRLKEELPSIYRLFRKVGKKSLPDEESLKLVSVKQKMGTIYGSSKVCGNFHGNGTKVCYNLEPELSHLMASSTNYDERFQIWKEWRRIVGSQVKPLYSDYVKLKNKLAIIRGYEDYGQELRDKYEMEGWEEEVVRIYKEMEPLYKELHAYIRRKLWQVYGEDYIDLKGPLPAHLLGDMWGRFWNNLFKIAEPFPGKAALDVSDTMKFQNWTGLKMFRAADDFYSDLGLRRVPDMFWERSMLKKPDDREVICHATAWDFYDAKDFRIKMCTSDYNYEDLTTIFHEMGHIQYFMQYSDKQQVFRDGANDGFHEAIGELMGMISATPSHLHKVGLLENLVEDKEQDLNFLMSQALITVSTLPFHLTNDLWTWGVMAGQYKEENWNDEFWKLKLKYVGVAPPVERLKNETFLDPPTLFHINQDYDMIRYFTRTILQFQFAEKLCELSGHKGPLHRCDFSGSKAAGAKLETMLKMGSTVPWQEALEKLTGGREMSANPIRKFFDPLYEYLKKVNKENGDEVGWNN